MNHDSRTNAMAVLVVVLASPLSFAQPPGDVPPRDPLPMIQLAQTIATEMGALCSKRFPDLKVSLDNAYQSWPLRSISITIQVNGNDYQNPTLVFLASTMRRDFFTEEEAKSRKGCEDYPAFLAKMASDIPPNILAPFVRPKKAP